MNAGRKVLEALIVYSKIEVKRDSDSKKQNDQNEEGTEKNNVPSYYDFNADAL